MSETRNDMIYGHGLQISATVKQSNAKGTPCVVISISDTIIKFNCSSQFNPESPISLKIEGLNIITANLLWKKGDEYGCNVDYVFHPAVLKAMVGRFAQPTPGQASYASL